MPRKSKNKKILTSNIRLSHGRSNLFVPKENIIDLKKVQQDKDMAADFLVSEQKTISHKIRHIKMPNFSLFKKNQAKEKNTYEKVIISNKRKEEKPVSQTITSKASVQTKAKDKQSKKEDKTGKTHVFSFQPSLLKSTVGFGMVIMLIILPVYLVSLYHEAKEVEGRVLGISTDAYDYLKEAGSLASSSDFTEASNSFTQAAQSFASARYQLEQSGGVLVDIARLVPNKAKTADSLLAAGQKLSTAGASFTGIIEKMENLQINPLEKDSESLTDFLVYIQTELDPVMMEMKSAVSDIKNVRIKDLPEQYQNTMTIIKNNLPALENGMDSLNSLSSVMLEILGHSKQQRYLLIFQNNRELRPTGGFIGSLALLDIYKGKIQNLEVPGGGVYDLAGQLTDKIISPKPLWLVNPHWNIQDSNWFPDFPTSVEKLEWFYEKTGKSSIDGVIALTPEVIVDLLEITGPIAMPEYDTAIDAENFIRTMQYQAEVAYDREENKPKKLIGDMLPKLFDRVFDSETKDFLAVIDVFSRSLSDKAMLMNFHDTNIQDQIAAMSWAGQIKDTDKDYLMVVATNIAGGKTDHVVEQLVTHQAEIDVDGSIINQVTIQRSHTGNQLDLFEGQDNVSYLRTYVPEGSELISVEGYDEMPTFRYLLPDEDAVNDDLLREVEQNSIIDETTGTRITNEFGKTVFGSWMSIAPGETQKLIIRYKIPFELDFGGLFDNADDYSLFVQKQPGQQNSYLISNIVLPDSLEFLWLQEGLAVRANQSEYATDLDGDKYYGLLISK